MFSYQLVAHGHREIEHIQRSEDMIQDEPSTLCVLEDMWDEANNCEIN